MDKLSWKFHLTATLKWQEEQCCSASPGLGMGKWSWCIPLHHSMLSPSMCASRANCVLLEGSCCLWGPFGDHYEFIPSVQGIREFILQCTMCNAPPAHVLSLSWVPISWSSVLGSLCGTTCGMNLRVTIIAVAVTYWEPPVYTGEVPGASQELAAPLPPFWNALFRAPSNPPVPLCWLRQVKKTTRLALLDLLQQSPSVCQGLAWGGLARAGCDLFLSHSWPVVTHGKPTAFASKSSMWIIIYFQNIWCATFSSDRSFDTSK